MAGSDVPSVAIVRNHATGKKYKVSVRKALQVEEGYFVAQDITVLTLKKNFVEVLEAPSFTNVLVRWERTVGAGRGELLSDRELIPLEGQLVLEVSESTNAASTNSSARPPPAPVVQKRETSTHLATPQRQELLNLAKHIFHGDSSLTFRDRDTRADPRLSSPEVQAGPGNGPRPDASDAADDDGYHSVVEVLRPERRSPSVHRGSRSTSVVHDDASRSPSHPSSNVWIERCLLLEKQKDSLEKKLLEMQQREESSARSGSCRSATNAPHREREECTTPATHPIQPIVPDPSRVTVPSKHLCDELDAVRRRRRMLREVRAAKGDEVVAHKQHLQSSIQTKKDAATHSLEHRIKAAKLQLHHSLAEIQQETAVVQGLQRDLDTTDAQADAEKVKVDEATRRLDRCKERMVALMTKYPPPALSASSLDQSDALRRKDVELAQFIAATAAQKHKHLVALHQRTSRTKHLRDTYEETLSQRVRLHHSVEDAKGNIRVVVRMRPVVPNDALQPQHIKHLEEGSLEVDELRNAVFLSTPTTGIKRFEFYSVYGPASDSVAQQGVVFEEQVKPLLKSVLDGTNVAVMAYGPTGSGKTFTILGRTESGQLSGLLPQSVEFLLDTLVANSESEQEPMRRVQSCTMNMVEVYLDQVYDILGQLHGSLEAASKLDVRQGVDAVSLSGVVEVDITKWEDAVRYIQDALRVRKTHRTLKNLESSRSHLIVTLHVSVQCGTKGSEPYRSKLVFVDLAGSERVSKSLSQGERLKEAQHINKSLSALGDVVHALSSTPRPSYIPYRNSRLTQLLFDALGGNAKTLLVTCICPHLPQQHNVSETQSTLQFASRVKSVRNALIQRSARDTLNSSKRSQDDSS